MTKSSSDGSTSGNDSDSSRINSSNGGSSGRRGVEVKRPSTSSQNRPRNIEKVESESDEDSSDESSDSSSRSSHGSVNEYGGEKNGESEPSNDDSDDGENFSRGGIGGANDNSSSDDDEDDEEGDDEGKNNANDDPDAPLAERLRINEEQGISLRGVRARKSRALQVATERLAKLKQQQQEQRSGGGNSKDTEEKVSQTTKGKRSASAGFSNDESSNPKKKSKHAPTEVSSKRSEFFKRGARRLNESGVGIEIGAHRYKAQDPRQSNMTGHLDEEHFEHNYAFLDEMRDKEIAQLKQRIVARKKTGSTGQQLRRKLQITQSGSLEEDQEELKKLLAIKAELGRNKLERTAKQVVQKKLRDEVAQGQRGAYFLKRKDKKRLVLEAKFDELRKRGGDKAVEKVLTKRRRKLKSRDAGLFAK
jgi:ribosomal RNA-processing protein 36